METSHGTKYRQLHIEDYLQEMPAEQGKVTGVYAHEWIAKRTRFAWKPGTKTTKTLISGGSGNFLSITVDSGYDAISIKYATSNGATFTIGIKYE